MEGYNKTGWGRWKQRLSFLLHSFRLTWQWNMDHDWRCEDVFPEHGDLPLPCLPDINCFFLKIYSTLAKHFSSPGNPPPKKWTHFLVASTTKHGHPKNPVFRQPPWSPVGIFWSSTWPSVWLTIGRPWLKDSKPRRISSLATQFFRLGIAKGNNWPALTFCVFFSS